MAIISFIILICLSLWHLLQTYDTGANTTDHISILALSIALGVTGLFIRVPGKGELRDYLANKLERNRQSIIGISCIMVGGLHFLTFAKATDIISMFGFMVILIAYYDLSSLAIRTAPYVRLDDVNGSTRRFIRYSGSKILIVIGIIFLMSTFMLFISLMGIVGFTGDWTVLVLSALLMGSLGMIIRSGNV